MECSYKFNKFVFNQYDHNLDKLSIPDFLYIVAGQASAMSGNARENAMEQVSTFMIFKIIFKHR